jgi:predicted metalloprotease
MRPARGIALGGGLGGIVLLVIVLLLGGDPGQLANLAPPTQQVPEGEYVGSAREEEQKQFVSVVLADTEEIWGGIFRADGRQYREPNIVLFTEAVQSACGMASSASGPFYCPPDEKVYLDLSFFDELHARFGAPGDFAAAYVIAHEVGHHVQKQMGLTDRVHEMKGRVSDEEYNRMSVRLELQADFLAGVWAHHAQQALGVLEPGDIEEALAAASAIGDDRLQKRSQGHVVPDAFTHGTSSQRVSWFRRGYETGDLSQGDTFSVGYEDL